jgi:hypothetical protein
MSLDTGSPRADNLDMGEASTRQIAMMAVGFVLVIAITIVFLQAIVVPQLLSTQDCPVPDAYGSLPANAAPFCHG